MGRVETAPLQGGSHEVCSAHFAVVIEYKDQEQTTELGIGSVPKSMTPADFGKFIAEDTEKWGKVIRAANIKPE